MLERLAIEVVPVVRKEAPTTLWTDQDPYGGRPALAGRQVADAAALIDASNAGSATGTTTSGAASPR
jgi:hypothetical protein